MIPESFKQDLLNRVDIVDVVSRYVQLKKGGANYLGLCPFHGEKTPSFTVSPSKQFYHCFGCGAHGNAIGFQMEYGGMIETINKMNRISRQILQETGLEPDPQTLAEKMEMPEEKIRKILKISKEPISMETPIGDDDDSHLGDFIEDQSTVAPSEAAVNASLRDVCKDILDTLTPREAKVLRMWR